jgi:hypothetical protein
MRYFLGLVLALLPFSGHTADLIPLSKIGIDQKTTERPITEKPSQDEHLVDQLWPYANPYHPTSATNFDVFTAPLVPSLDGNDRSRLSLYLSDSAPNPAVYGHFGNPLFPDSINRRNETGHPYALDGPTNHFGRSWLLEKR